MVVVKDRLALAIQYWHTLRHLRPSQFYHRLWFRLARPRPVLSAAPSLRESDGTWISPAAYQPSLVGPARFRFLNVEHDLAVIGWDDPKIAKLWRYNQHYFTDLSAVGAAARSDWHRALLDDWRANNSPGRGSGWEPYPLSLRIVNLIKWALSGHVLSSELIESLAIQTRWLEKRIEWHLLANHLFVNGKALLFAGLFFAGPEADRWRRKGAAILSRELDEQILDDGGQFELSPMYHLLALDDVLDVINLIRWSKTHEHVSLLAAFEGKARPMQHWLRAMCHPDGEIALFNDAAFAIAPPPAAMLAYADRLGLGDSTPLQPVEWLRASGYIRLNSGDAVLIADAAEVGPTYQAGHAHADTLSFELSIGEQRVIVNGGTSVYGTDDERSRQRGTLAHSTVTVGGINSSDVWGGFRVGRRARPCDVRAGVDGGSLYMAAAHDGYRHLPDRPIHHRDWLLTHDSLRIEDRLSNKGQSAEARFHLHPGVTAHIEGNGGTLVLPNGRRVAWRAKGGAAMLAPSSWHPEFGVDIASGCIIVQLDQGRACLDLDWN